MAASTAFLGCPWDGLKEKRAAANCRRASKGDFSPATAEIERVPAGRWLLHY
jgi:hypothetical protein